MSLLEPTPDGLVPSALAAGPWGSTTLAGQVVTGLVARGAEREVDAAHWRGARVAVDLVRMSSMTNVRSTATVTHESRRLLLVEVELTQDHGVIARGRITFVLRGGEAPRGQVWTSDTAMPSPPPSAGRGTSHPFDQLVAYAGVGDEGSSDPARWATGVEPKYLWWNLDHELVAGETMTPLTRAAYLADTTSPLTAWGTEGLGVINADVSLTLVRDPEGTVLGLEARDHLTGQGGASGAAVVHDTAGPLGLASVVSLTYPRDRNSHAPSAPGH